MELYRAFGGVSPGETASLTPKTAAGLAAFERESQAGDYRDSPEPGDIFQPTQGCCITSRARQVPGRAARGASNPGNLSLYAFVGNNPANAFDLLGLDGPLFYQWPDSGLSAVFRTTAVSNLGISSTFGLDSSYFSILQPFESLRSRDLL